MKCGGSKQKAAEKALSIIKCVQDGLPVPGKLTNHGESRIKHCFKYDLPGACRLVTIENEDTVWFLSSEITTMWTVG